MSRTGSFAGFFPTAPSVQQQRKWKRAATDYQTVETVSASRSDDPSAHPTHHGQSPSHHGQHRQQRQTQPDLEAVAVDAEDRINLNGDGGDLLNGVGSASSLNSTVSSVFSTGGPHGMPGQQLSGVGSQHALTPLTNHDSSPPGKLQSPRHEKGFSNQDCLSADGFVARETSIPNPQSFSATMTPDTTPPQERTRIRPDNGEAKGERAIYDPELDQKLPSKDKRKLKVRYRPFGETEHSPPPDPRLALPGYKDGDLSVRLKDEAKVWKNKNRTAPYILHRYSWDPKLSIGAGPPTAIVVTGFDPLTPEAQIRAFFGSFGDIAALEKRTDPNTGSFLSICSIRYKDSSLPWGSSISAIDAARKAEKEGTGQRIGLHTVKAERDRSGKRCKRYVEGYARRKKEEGVRVRAAAQASEEAKKQQFHDSAPYTIPAPPPNAPRGPSGRNTYKAPDVAKPLPPARSALYTLVEHDPILPGLKRKPYVFISSESVPVQGTTIPHLKKRLKAFDWREVRCDESGYFVVFEDSKFGEDETVRCYKGSHMMPLFTYTMVMECQQYGNPNYERSPSPERAMAQRKQKEEQDAIRREELLDIEEEKRQRSQNLDPVQAALEQLRTEVRDKTMSDVKARIAAPALYDYLEPSRHSAKRRKLGIPDPVELQQAPVFLSMGDETPSSRTPAYRAGASSTFMKPSHASSHSISRIRREDLRQTRPINAFVDERRQRPPKRKTEIRPLHHRLHDFYGGNDSDEEEKHSSREDSKDQDSRPMSRASSVAPVTERDDEKKSRKRRRLEREQTSQDEESGEDNYGIARSVLDPHILKKEPEDMAMQELQLIINTLPSVSKLHKGAKRELGIRMRNRDDDQLFHIKAELLDETKIEDAGLLVDSDALDAATISLRGSILPKKRLKSKKKSKKQIFEEREAAKASLQSAKALLQSPVTSSHQITPSKEISHEKARDEEEEEEDEEMEEAPPEVEWGVSADIPRRTVQDDDDFVLDVDGWQHLVKDEEDMRFLREAVADLPSAKEDDFRLWAFLQKNVKALNSSGEAPGVIRDDIRIKGYYVPNPSGSARTQGVEKILEAEKSKYLPHRIKVVQAREKREAEVKNDSFAQAEATRRAKLASNATSRSNRANNRTQVKDLNTVKQSLAADGQGDTIRFNQLQKRKKLVKFDRSAIHGWGLYAEEDIAVSDMIIEYVGEKVRQAVANIREIRYDKQGMGSSYLFRIDEDTVVDATKKGGIARFINHSCEPNCTAKIIKVDGTKRIVIYALKEIAKNEELTYDYKFDREMDNEDRVPCLCGSATCKKFLN